MGAEPDVKFVDLPSILWGKYQYYTCANLDKLRAAGFTAPVTSLEDGLKAYVHDYLETADVYR
jgi:ADP-L-glycero-D-manno-heptose 6-epimerase